jgi:hypothetical protein
MFTFCNKTGRFVFKCACETTEEPELPCTKQKGLQLLVEIKQICECNYERNEQTDSQLHAELHGIMLQLCETSWKFEHVMRLVVSAVNIIQPHELNYGQFPSFMSEIDDECEAVLYHL